MLSKMKIFSILLFSIIIGINFIDSKEWCKAASEFGKPEYAVCIPDGEAEAKYTIEVVPIVAPGLHLLNDVSISIVGVDGKSTKHIPIASQSIGTQKKIFADRLDIGDPIHLHIESAGLKPWKCQRITVWKDYKYWVFDCIGILNEKNPSAIYEVSGNKLYEATVQTGNDPQAGTIGGIEITLSGDVKQASPKMLKQGFYSASQTKVRFRAADVGEIEGITIKNTYEDDPWYCDFIRIKAEDGRLYAFTIKRWIGAPYDTSISVKLKPSRDLDIAAQDIECHTRVSDLFSRVSEELHVFKVRCPMNCQSSEFARVQGITIHPSSSSICASAIMDGILSSSGGEVVISVVGELPNYSAYNSTTGILAEHYTPSSDMPAFSYFLYLSDSIDDIDRDVRVVNSYGKLSAAGRLEIRRNGVWGSVCRNGVFTEVNNETAKKSCQELGYLHGILLNTPCSFFNGQNVCAGKGYPVSVAGVMCVGTESSLEDCTFEEPTESCKDHSSDVVVQCTNHPPDREPESGTLRIVDITGAPSQNGIGRLEYFMNGFGTVCRDGWTKESERVACLEMGFSGLLKEGASNEMCSDVKGVNYCGDKQKIAIVNVSCLGDEKNLRHCPHELKDPDCIHEEDVVIACEGHGDSSGIGLFRKEDPPSVIKRKFHPKISMNCGDRIVTVPELNGLSGSMFVGVCPENCSEEPGEIKGTYIYSADSPICKAAIHAGAIDNMGGEIVVSNGHAQENLFGSERFGIISQKHAAIEKTFTVSRAVPSVRAFTAQEKQNIGYAGESKMNEKTGASFPKFVQLKNSNIDVVIPDKFHWYPTSDWNGFRGKEFIDTKNLFGSKAFAGFRDFTVTVRARVSENRSSWRCIIAHSQCEGFELALNSEGVVIFEQPCHKEFISTGFKPAVGEWFHIAVSYFQPERAIAIFANGQKVAYEKTNLEFNLRNSLVIGRASETDSEFFFGDITAVQAFDYVLSPEQIRIIMEQSAISPVLGSDSVTNIRRTEDGRICVSSCTMEAPKVELYNGKYPTNPSIDLSCQDSIISPLFNGKSGHKVRVRCPPGCIHQMGNISGNKLYSEGSSICKAAIHAGALPREGGEAIVTINNGLHEYEGVRGHNGVISVKEHLPQIRSFSVCRAPNLIQLSCFDDGGFMLKMGIEEKQLVLCPSGCQKVENAKVYGTDTYSPISSVCRAAMHAGVLQNTGGEIEIMVGPEFNQFKGSIRNGIKSERSEYYLRSFECLRGSVNHKNERQTEL